MVVKKSTLIYWVIVFILQVIFIGTQQGFFNKVTWSNLMNITDSHVTLEMTAKQATLVKDAFSLVKGDVTAGKIQSIELALSALYAELPMNVRANVLKAIGSPTLSKLPSVLDRVETQIKIKG